MTVNPLALANKVLDIAAQQSRDITPLQLQKLLYFINGWHLEINDGEELISGSFQAWKFGPVHPKVYHEFKHYGSLPITGRSENPFTQVPWAEELSNSQEALISEVLSIYGNLSGPQMSNLTHKQGTPWSETWNNGVGDGDNIPPQRIIQEFKSIRERANAA